MTENADELQREIAALRRTNEVLVTRVEALQNRRSNGFAMFEGMAHLEALVAERTEELRRAKAETEAVVERRTRELRDKADQLERANAMLQEMDRMKTHLLQNVSHELKTPLVSIRGYAELLRVRYAANLDDNQREFLDIVVRNADHLNRVIEDLVQASQSARGVSPFEVADFGFQDIVREAVEELRPFAEKNAVELSAEVPVPACMVHGDRRQVRQMVVNILSNAVKFSSGCPRRVVQVKTWCESGDAVLEVVDSGIGIAKDKLARIFDRFYQVDPTATRRYGGMGIGLSLVREVVEGHQGTIFVESEPGRGTRFLVRLPLAEPAAPAAGAALAGAPPAAADRADVIVVEDQEESAVFYSTALEEFGYKSRAFTSAVEALRAIPVFNPGLILLDLSMPEMSGLEFLEVLAQRTPAAAMPVVVLMTARSPDETAAFDLGDRIRTILYKPFSLEMLRRVLYDALPPVRLRQR